jgi:CRP-like cAMP-binding protein
MTLETCEREQFLFEQNDVGTTFYVVLTGSVQVIVQGNRVAILEEGAAFGEMSLVRGEPRAAGIKCADNCEFMMIAKKDYDRILKGNATYQIEQREGFIRDLPQFSRKSKLVSAFFQCFRCFFFSVFIQCFMCFVCVLCVFCVVFCVVCVFVFVVGGVVVI